MTQAGKLTDPNFTVDSYGGYCTVRVADSLSVVVINEVSSVIIEVYHNTEDDAPIETMQFPKGNYEDVTIQDINDMSVQSEMDAKSGDYPNENE